MRSLRNRLLVSSGVATLVTGVSLAFSTHPAAAQGIIINPIIKGLLDLVINLHL